jgi:hypothetical protein
MRAFGPYDPLAYASDPWLGVVIAWPVGETSRLRFGAYSSAGYGQGGTAEVSAHVGDVVRWGQKASPPEPDWLRGRLKTRAPTGVT